jgi:hypothetical protein
MSEARMYTTAVRQDFIAQHCLIGGDWGAENEKHSHHYQVEVQLVGQSLISMAIWSTLWMSHMCWMSWWRSCATER